MVGLCLWKQRTWAVWVIRQRHAYRFSPNPTYVRCRPSQSSHRKIPTVLYKAHSCNQRKGNRHIGLGGHHGVVCIWFRSSCFQTHQGLLDMEAVGWGTQAEKCVLLVKLKQRDRPWGSSVMSMLPISSCLSQEEGGGRAGNQRLSHVMLVSIESLQQRILPQRKRCFCPETRYVKSDRGQIKVFWWWLVGL